MIRLGSWFDVALAIAHVTVTTVALAFALSIWLATILSAGVTGLVLGGLWLWSWKQERAERLARERYQEWRRKTDPLRRRWHSDEVAQLGISVLADVIFYLNPGSTLR